MRALKKLENTNFNMQLETSQDVAPVRLKTSFSSFFYEQLKKIDNYGCWCSFSDDTGFHGGEPGYGRVMDEIDQICKDLRQGYRCAVIDDDVTNNGGGKNNGQGCIPWAANYSSSNSLLTDEGQILEACQLDNAQVENSQKDCAVRACALENTFILDFIKYLVSGKQVNPEFIIKTGAFDRKSNCPIPKNEEEQGIELWARSAQFMDYDMSGSGEGEGNEFDEEHIFSSKMIPEKMCCGEYPKRFPFLTRNGQRACCNKRTYDTSKFECCEGRVAVNCL